jgi:tetratricopeptide (TPR) repeat protein
MEALPAARPAYRAAFAAGLVLLAVALLGGFTRVAVRDHAVPGLAQDPLLDAARLAGLGAGDSARAEYAAAVLVNQGDDHLLVQAGAGLRDAGHHAEAEAVLRRALAMHPRAATHRHLGYTLLREGRLDEAAASFEAALRLDPADSDALAGMGEVLISRDRYAEAAGVLRRAVAAGPPSAARLNSLGIALALGGDPAAAIEPLEAAAGLSPTPDILANLDRARKAAGR